MEIHEAATFGKARPPGSQGTTQGCAHRRVPAQGLGVEFGIAAAEIETVTGRQGFIMERTEKDEVRSGLLQDLEAVFILETEGFVLGNGYDSPARASVK